MTQRVIAALDCGSAHEIDQQFGLEAVLTMRRELSLEVVLGPQNDPLVRVTQALRELASLPETLVWSAVPGTDEARIWLVITATDPCFQTLLTDLKAISGIRSISRHGPGQDIILSLYHSAP